MALRQKTVDMLDAHVSSEYAIISGASEQNRDRLWRESFRLDRINWDTYYTRFNTTVTSNGLIINWQEFKYADVLTNTSLIDTSITSTDTGIYMFVVQSQHAIYHFSKFVLYVGISGENNSLRPLKDRLKDYYRLKHIRKRDAVLRILEKYKENVHVVYFLVNTSTAVLKELEQALIGFFYPIANKDDFPVELQPSVKAKF